MGAGIRAELKVPAAVGCQMAHVSAEGDVTTYSVSKSVDPNVPERVTEEFAVESDGAIPELDDVDVAKVFDGGAGPIYRFERSGGQHCPCECIEAHGFPVVDVRARNGTLFLVFHTPDQDALRDVIAEIREHHPQVEVRRLVQSRDDSDDHTLAFFDKSVFTDRQREVLETAHRLGYFQHPKGANAGEVAEELGITTATFIEHLSAAQRKLLDAVLADDAE